MFKVVIQGEVSVNSPPLWAASASDGCLHLAAERCCTESGSVLKCLFLIQQGTAEEHCRQ